MSKVRINEIIKRPTESAMQSDLSQKSLPQTASTDLVQTKTNESESEAVDSVVGSNVKSHAYQSLLPDARAALREGEKLNEAGAESKHSHSSKIVTGRQYGLTGARLAPKEDYNFDQLASKLIIPHEWREKADESHAVAMIRRDDKSNLWLDSLHGDPMLRAILYQNLMRPEFLNSLDLQLTDSDITEFKIVLRFLAQNDSYRGLNTEISAFRDGLVVTKTLPPVMRIFKGMPLTDHWAERAKIREQIEIKKLMELPAFHRRIENLLLKAG